MNTRNEYINYKKKDLYIVLSDILDNVNDDGSWGSSDYEDWKCVLTTLTVELLLSCNVDANATWFVNNKKVELNRSFEYLDNQIQSDGKFGEDYWDACRLGVVINKYAMSDKFKNYSKLHNYIMQSIENKTYQNNNEGWSGPGFYAMTINYLDSLKTIDPNISNLANTIYDELTKLQCSDGSFKGATNKSGQFYVSPVWHTSHVLLTFIRRGIAQSDEKIQKIVSWLKQEQEEDGSFSNYKYTVMCTSYAIIALSDLPDCHYSIEKGIKFLHTKIDGHIDSAERIMTALALRRRENPQLYFNATVLDLKNLETLESRNTELNQKCENNAKEIENKDKTISKYETKYKDVGIVFTQTQAWILGLVFSTLLAFCFYLLGTQQSSSNVLPKTNTQNEIPIEHK